MSESGILPVDRVTDRLNVLHTDLLELVQLHNNLNVSIAVPLSQYVMYDVRGWLGSALDTVNRNLNTLHNDLQNLSQHESLIQRSALDRVNGNLNTLHTDLQNLNNYETTTQQNQMQQVNQNLSTLHTDLQNLTGYETGPRRAALEAVNQSLSTLHTDLQNFSILHNDLENLSTLRTDIQNLSQYETVTQRSALDAMNGNLGRLHDDLQNLNNYGTTTQQNQMQQVNQNLTNQTNEMQRVNQNLSMLHNDLQNLYNYVTTALHYLSQQNETVICFLKQISKQTCDSSNENHAQTQDMHLAKQLLWIMAFDDKDLTTQVKGSFPPTETAKPICTFTPCKEPEADLGAPETQKRESLRKEEKKWRPA